jgi:hypothetical protein
MEQQKVSCISGGKTMVESLGTTFWQSHRKLNVHLPDNLAISFLGIFPKRNENISPHKDLSLNAYCSFVCNSLKLEIAQTPINR